MGRVGAQFRLGTFMGVACCLECGGLAHWGLDGRFCSPRVRFLPSGYKDGGKERDEKPGQTVASGSPQRLAWLGKEVKAGGR